MRVPRLLYILVGLFATRTATAQLPDTGYMGHNKQFGVSDPKDNVGSTRAVKIWGIDISQWQGNVDFNQVKTAASFVVIRVTRGAPDQGQTSQQYVDTKYLVNRQRGEAAGIPLGFYHFAYPEFNSPVLEANNFCDNVGTLKPGQFVVLDYESPWTGDPVAWSKAFLDHATQRLGIKPLIYLNLSTARGYNWSPVINAGYGLWLARWDYDKNAAAPTTPWPFVAMRQYSDRETIPGITGAVDGNVFYGDLQSLLSYGYSSPAAVIWASPLPTQNRWYRSNERVPYSVSGGRPNVVKEYIDGSLTATKDTDTGFFDLNLTQPGWHNFEVTASNTSNPNSPSTTGKWTGGWDPVPPTVARTGGASPNTWYTTAASVDLLCSDTHSGVRHYRFKWGQVGTFSDWITGTTASLALPEGKNRLFVEVEDDAYQTTTASGNTATIDLGEFWKDSTPPAIQASNRFISTNATSTSIEFALTNPGSAPVTNVAVDSAQFGSAKSAEIWSPGPIGGLVTVRKTFVFPVGMANRKVMLLSVNYRLGDKKFRYRARILKP